MVWRGSSVGALLVTVFSGVGMASKPSSHSDTSVGGFAWSSYWLIAVIPHVGAPRVSSWLRRPSQPEHDWVAGDTSLTGRTRSVCRLIEPADRRRRGVVKDRNPKLSSDGSRRPRSWGTNGMFLTVGPTTYRVDVTSPSQS